MRWAVIAPLIVAAAGCGTTFGERAVSGAAIGAAAGAAVGALTGITVVQGTLAGAAAGGVAGAATGEEQLNLGDPVWKGHEIRTNVVFPNLQSQPPAAARVREVQQALKALGFYEGPVNGSLTPGTQTAIKAYQERHGLNVDGVPSEALRRHLRAQTAE